MSACDALRQFAALHDFDCYGGKGDLFQTWRKIAGNDPAPSFVRSALDTPSGLDDHAF
jgi:hypothetical protein